MADEPAIGDRLDRLWQAAKRGNLQVIKQALDSASVTVHEIDKDGNTLLHMAASQGHKALVKELLRRGADPAVTNFSGKKCYDLAHELNYWELGDYIREKLSLEKLGPSNKWMGEPGAPSLGGEITDDAISQLMQRRERQQRLSESWRLLAQVDMELVIASVIERELSPTKAAAAAADPQTEPAAPAAGQRTQQEIQQSEEEALKAIQRLRDALGDAMRAKTLERALEQIWNRSSVFRLSEHDAREAAAEVATSKAGSVAGARSGMRLEEELGRLGVQMRGMDVEGLVAALKTCEEEKKKCETRCLELDEASKVAINDLAQERARRQSECDEFASKLGEVEAANRAASTRISDLQAHLARALHVLSSSVAGVLPASEVQAVVRSCLGAGEGEGCALMEDVPAETLGQLFQGLVAAMCVKIEEMKQQVKESSTKLAERTQERDDLSLRVQESALKPRLEGGLHGVGVGGGGDGVMWSELDVQERVQTLEARWASEMKEERERLERDFNEQMEALERQVTDAREEATEALQRKEAELRECNQWATERGQEAAELRGQVRQMQAKVAQGHKIVRDKDDEVRQLKRLGNPHAHARMTEALGEFRDGLRTFRSGLVAWKEHVLGVVETTNANLSELGSELVGFIGMVMPLPHVDAPLKLDTSKLSRQQLGTAVRHVLGKYREADARARWLNAALQDSRYVKCTRMMREQG